jgi:hypothetical protein
MPIYSSLQGLEKTALQGNARTFWIKSKVGSGTTTKVAESLDRRSIGYELNRDYLPIIRQKSCSKTVALSCHAEMTCVWCSG